MRARYVNTNEGVGDEYVFNKHGINRDFDEFDRKFIHVKNKKRMNLIGSFISRAEEEVDVYKNPDTLDTLQSWIRACSDRYGNLFVADNQDILHDELAYFLTKQGMKDDFVDWQRLEDTNEFYLAEGYDLGMHGLEYELDDNQKETINNYAPKVKNNNPQYIFIYNKTILET